MFVHLPVYACGFVPHLMLHAYNSVCAIPFEVVCLSCVGRVVYGVFGFLTAFRVWRAGGLEILWAVGFQEGVKNYTGKYEVVVIEVVVGYVFGMDVKPFDRV